MIDITFENTCTLSEENRANIIEALKEADKDGEWMIKLDKAWVAIETFAEATGISLHYPEYFEEREGDWI